MFWLTYIRTTEENRSTIEDRTFFSDTAFRSHQDALFARYYFDAWDSYRAGAVPPTPPAWQLALEAADNKSATRHGSLRVGG